MQLRKLVELLVEPGELRRRSVLELLAQRHRRAALPNLMPLDDVALGQHGNNRHIRRAVAQIAQPPLHVLRRFPCQLDHAERRDGQHEQ